MDRIKYLGVQEYLHSKLWVARQLVSTNEATQVAKQLVSTNKTTQVARQLICRSVSLYK